MQILGFELGREWKLSVAEILSVFEGEIIFSGNGVLLLATSMPENIGKIADTLGGTIKIFEAELKASVDDIYADILHYGFETEGKYKYSLNLFGNKSIGLEKLLKKSKYELKNRNISARYFNKDNGKNLSSAQILGNSILKKGYDFNIVNLGNMFYFGKTLWVQDIDAYAKRDFEKETDMQVGMLPPKLCQIMINLGSSQKTTSKSLYDPFVGLGTVLIEAANMGVASVFGSDLSEKMVETASKNLEDFCEKEGLETNYSIIKLNAKFIHEAPFFSETLDLIVTEGYLGEVMTKKNISSLRIGKQKDMLAKLYASFFENLRATDFTGNIVICFPFWELEKNYIYFHEIHEILEKNGFETQKNFPDYLTTKMGSFLYKRQKQLVGREIYILKKSLGNS